MIKERSKELLKKAFYRGNEVADMPSYYYEGLADEWEKWYNENVENILPLYIVSEPLQARRHITEKELMIASKELHWRGGEVEYLIKKVRDNQTKSNAR